MGIIGRALFSASEHKTSQYLKDHSGLCDLHHIAASEISHRDLYSIADTLYGHKDRIDQFLYNRIVDLFEMEDSLVIYDLSNTLPIATNQNQNNKPNKAFQTYKRGPGDLSGNKN